MKSATVKQLKDELSTRQPKELLELTLRLAKFKKENKELLTYLLFEANDEAGYIISIKEEMDLEFETMNRKSYFYMKKSIRKILRNSKKYIRYTLNKETEVEVLIYFCRKLKDMKPSIRGSIMLRNLYDRQILAIYKKLPKLDEDLQYDYKMELDDLSY